MADDLATIDWNRVEANLASFPHVARAVKRGTAVQRFGSCPIVLEWLHAGRPGTLLRVQAIDADLARLEQAQLPGFDRLLMRLATGNRQDVFATLAELFVAAWYCRSDHRVVDVHADQGQGDVVIGDGTRLAHVEVRDLSAPAAHYFWDERWGELRERLELLGLPFLLDFHGVNDLRYELVDGGTHPEPVRATAPELTDIDWIIKQVKRASSRPRPWVLACGFSRKYPDLTIEASDRYSGGVIGSWGSSGWAFPAHRLVDRILKKAPPSATGRRILMVEISRHRGETLTEEWSRGQARQLVARQVRSWDAIVAFSRQWIGPDVAQVYVLHLRSGSGALLPVWGQAANAPAVRAGSTTGSRGGAL